MTLQNAEAGAEVRTSRKSIGVLLPAVVVAGLFLYFAARYYFVCDDCFISLRYARNLVDGHGLVYNPGERVEGYTNFLWTLLAAGLMKLGLDPELPLNLVGIASALAILAIVLRLGIERYGWKSPLPWIAPLGLALNRSFCAWATAGLETQLFSLLALAGLTSYVAECRDGRGPGLRSGLLLATATLTRPEGMMFFAIAGFFTAIDLLRRRTPLGRVARCAAVYLLIVGSHLAWRYSYYGYPLPNTFYAKVSGFWWEQSREWMGRLLEHYQLIGFLPLIGLSLLLSRQRLDALFAVVLTAYTAYLVYIGGDHFEFRLATPALPYLYWLIQSGVGESVRFARSRGLRPSIVLPPAVGVGALLAAASWSSNARGFQGLDVGIISVEQFHDYTEERREQGLFLRQLVERGYLTGDEVIAVGGAGALPYFSGLTTVDFRGLNDEHVAHSQPSDRSWIGHEKAASFEYLAQRGVAIWDVENRIVRPPGSPQPQPHAVNRPFYAGMACIASAEKRHLVFATTLDVEEFRRTFSKFDALYYGDPEERRR